MIYPTWKQALDAYNAIPGRALIRCIAPGTRYLVADGAMLDSWIMPPKGY